MVKFNINGGVKGLSYYFCGVGEFADKIDPLFELLCIQSIKLVYIKVVIF